MAGGVFVLEPRFVREIGEAAGTAATDTARRIVGESTAEIRERLERLENLQELQDRIAADRQAAESDLINKVGKHPDFESTSKLLERAENLCLFDDLELRTGCDRTLMKLTWVDADHLSRIEYVEIGVMYPAPGELDLLSEHIVFSAISTTGKVPFAKSYWFNPETLQVAWNSFLDACQREDIPTTQIKVTEVFKALAESYQAMMDSRHRTRSDPRRLQGKLRLLVNDEWVITTAGLESRISSHCSQSHPAEDAQSPAGHNERLWQEAAHFFRLTVDL